MASAVLHLIILAWLVLPRVPTLTPADAPVNVDLVTSSELASLERAPSSAPPSSSAPASSSAASSMEPSSVAGSSVEAASAAASSAESQAASSRPLPAGRPVAGKAAGLVVPVGQADLSSEEQSSEASSAASEIASSTSEAASSESTSAASEAPASALTAASGGSDSAASALAASEVPPPPVGGGTLHPAKHFYLAEMLRAPGLAQVRDTLKTLPPERRLAQTCMIEALGQAGHAGYDADAIVPNAFAPIVAAGQTYAASGGAVRSAGSWYRIAYDCTLSPDMGKVTAFSFHIGADVTSELTSRLGGTN